MLVLPETACWPDMPVLSVRRCAQGLLPPVIAVPILDAGDASIRFFAPSRWGMGASYMRLRLRSDALRQAPWLHLEGGQSFWLTARMLGATALTLRKPTRSWRYWRWPWRAPDRTVEGPEFCAALPATKQALVLTSRPGHLLIRADYQREPSLEFERAVNLAIAWVKAVQQTAGAPRT